MTLCACIIETRPLPNLIQIIKDHMKFLPEGTPLMIYCGDQNLDMLQKEFAYSIHGIFKGEFGVAEYNRTLTNPHFWAGYCGIVDRVLIFQSDSMLLRTGIEEFLNYDYVGAPWKWNDHHVGNGGLSLRNPRVMKEICEKYPHDGSLNEDHWITKHMYDHKIGNLAPKDVAARFSVEAEFALGSLGYHAIDKWLSTEQCKQIKEQYL